MKINNLKINGFGKIENKEINFKDGINLVCGENEAGKSTLLKFIIGIFYGLSKNKNGQTIPDNEKYEPWNGDEFSGKIEYELDNNEKYEVYRDFKKKNPKIFNENLEDISKKFNIDKTKGNQFFYDQVGIEEDIFTSTIVTKQSEVQLDEKKQNGLIQKISNMLGTGDDSKSFSQIVTKLRKKLNDEVGTANTKEKPINLVQDRINELENYKNELLIYENSKFDIDNNIIELKDKINLENKELNKLRQVNLQKEKLKEKENLIKLNNEILQKYENDIQKVKEEKERIQKGNKKKKSNLISTVCVGLAILSAILILILDNLIIRIALICVATMLICVAVYNFYKNKKEKSKTKKQILEKQSQIKVLQDSIKQKENEINILKNEYKDSIEKIKKENNMLSLDNILEQIDKKQSEINNKSIQLHTLEVDKNSVIPKLEKLVNIEEELEDLKEEKNELEAKGKNIKRTLEYLEIAYKEMKEQITPKFTDELSKTIENISSKKYSKVRINTNGEIIVENSNGEYINAENLSLGTIDQLYLSLRIAAIKEITNENMPIILDEAFVYYDDKRLENILKYLEQNYKDKQIIIFSCSKREKNILEKENICYNFVEL